MAKTEKELEPVQDRKVVERYLRYGLEFHEIVDCFLESGDLRFRGEIKAIDPANLTLELEVETPLPNLSVAAVEKLDEPQALLRLSYSVDEATFFVDAKVQKREGQLLRLQAALPMYKLQRRDALRIKVLLEHRASVTMAQRVFPIQDISAGGLAISVKPEEKDEFPVGRVFRASVVSFVGQQVTVDLEVKNAFEPDGKRTELKVGFGFHGLPSRFEQLIVREAYLHTRKIWSRWL